MGLSGPEHVDSSSAMGSTEPKAILPHKTDAIKLCVLSVGLRVCIKYGDRRKATYCK